MPEIYFIRHGQASFGSENYDNLSNLGKRQSKIVGSYFKKIDLTFDRIISGTLNRQLQTCNHIIKEISFSNDPEKTILLNEYNVRSTPSFLINGILVEGHKSIKDFRQILDKILSQ